MARRIVGVGGDVFDGCYGVARRFVGIGFLHSFFDVTTNLSGVTDVWHDGLSALVVTVTAATVWHDGFVGVGFSDFEQ